MEALRPHEGAEVGAQRRRVLPGLVLRPAVEFRLAEALGFALGAIRPQRGAAAVVTLDLLAKIALVETLLVQR